MLLFRISMDQIYIASLPPVPEDHLHLDQLAMIGAIVTLR